jgi:hypothetical protein
MRGAVCSPRRLHSMRARRPWHGEWSQRPHQATMAVMAVVAVLAVMGVMAVITPQPSALHSWESRPCSEVQCSEVQCSAVQACSEVQDPVRRSCGPRSSCCQLPPTPAVQCIAVQCSAVQCSAVQCSIVCIIHCSVNTLYSCGNTVQCPVCSALQIHSAAQ